MSAVTLQEIADLVAARLKMPVASMRGLRGNSAETRSAMRARLVVVVLARRHTLSTYPTLAAFFNLAPGNRNDDRMRDAVRTEEAWRGADPELDWAIEDIEQQIDALHERRMTTRDRMVSAPVARNHGRTPA